MFGSVLGDLLMCSRERIFATVQVLSTICMDTDLQIMDDSREKYETNRWTRCSRKLVGVQELFHDSVKFP
jgi:hypothetical protein